ncbi:MAG: hypothetical protein IMF08_08050 [Proteobacteria bacterium]|nr:hypothetical protein [Pseudomonadota bacterium]
MLIRPITVVLLTLLALPATARAESQPLPLLGEHRFTAGGYSLVGLTWGRPRHPVQDQLGDFYVDNPALLEELKALWVTGPPAPMYACGYHYTVLLIRDARTVESFSINLETGCGTVVTDAGSYHFDAALLSTHADRYRKPVVERREFASLAEGRDFLSGLAGNERLLLMPQPRWRDYDGEFRFMLPCPDHGYDEVKVTACIAKARAEIEVKFPGEEFDLSEAGGEGDRIMIEMKSSKALHTRFDLYEDYWEWRDYEPGVTLYWRAAA